MRLYHAFSLASANALLPIAVLFFAQGFFPHKPFLPGLAEYHGAHNRPPPEAPFNKVIFMVVDALRSDFVFSHGSGFKFIHQLVNEGAALPFTAHASSPTVTMPRVKALTTGSIPSFLDAILNLAEGDESSTLAHQDTWLAQMLAKQDSKLVMYGDDTWLKLFPGMFSRADGTTSFFVSDFTEVDNNVTRHISHEMGQNDWNAMIMHYLGLDHIGHKAGPKSPNMLPKQSEMDGIVQQIYTAMEKNTHLQSALMIVCGDHGMNDAGNHGGSSPGETSTGLVFISPKFAQITNGSSCPTDPNHSYEFYHSIEQSDIVPTLAGLLGFPVPKNNLGVFIPDMLEFWENDSDKVWLLLENARQILHLIEATGSSPSFERRPSKPSCPDSSTDLQQLGRDWQEISELLEASSRDSSSDNGKLLSALAKFTKRGQRFLSGAASNYDMFKITLGMILALGSVSLALMACFPVMRKPTTSVFVFLGTTVAYSVMMFASSYVEEEHHFWYWAASAWLVYVSRKTSRKLNTTTRNPSANFVPIIAGLRIARRWNQTGQKFAGEPDIARTFLPKHTELLWVLAIATYVNIIYRHSRRRRRQLSAFPAEPYLTITLGYLALWFKAAYTVAEAPELLWGLPHFVPDLLANTPLLLLARTVFLGILVSLVVGWKCSPSQSAAAAHDFPDVFHDLLSLFLLTQSRVTNVPLFLIFDKQLHFLRSAHLSALDITITSILFQHVSFFALGNSNSISSIDLSNAYNGVGGYNVGLVGFLTFVSNWAGPLWWTSATVLLLLQHDSTRRDESQVKVSSPPPPSETSEPDRIHPTASKPRNSSLVNHLLCLTLFTTTTTLFVMAACTALRTHLFIWTVFSPKYLFTMAWTIGQHLAVNVLFGTLLFWCGDVTGLAGGECART